MRWTFLFLLALLLLPINISLSSPAKYYARGITLDNGGMIAIGGGYSIKVIKRSAGGYVTFNVYCPSGYTSIDLRNGEKGSIYGGCSVWGMPGSELFTISLIGGAEVTESSIIFNVEDSIFNPAETLDVQSTFSNITRYEGAQVFNLPFSIVNTGDKPVYNATLQINWMKVNGSGDISILQVAPPKNITKPLYYSLSLDPKAKQDFTLTTKVDPGGKYYATYMVGLSLSYKSAFSYNKTASTADRIVYDFKNTTVSVSKTFFIIVGEKYKGRAGNPELWIIMKNPLSVSLLVNPGDVLTFRFCLKNNGGDSAFNSSVYVKVQPQTSKGPFITITQPLTIAGKKFPVNLPEIPKGAMTQDIEFTMSIPQGTEGMTFMLQIAVDYMDIRDNLYSVSKNFTIDVKKPGIASLVLRKTVGATEIGVDQELDVMISIVNNGTAPALSVSVSDSYPDEFFDLVSGKTTGTFPKINPGETATLSYKLRAKSVGTATFGPAKATYTDQSGLTKASTSQQEPIIVNIVKPEVSITVREVPPPATVVNSIFPFSIVISNKGTGKAQGFTLNMTLSASFQLVTAPRIDTAVNAQCSPPYYEPAGNVSKISLICSSIDPDGNVEVKMLLKPVSAGNASINIDKAMYTSYGSSYNLDTKSYSYHILVTTPIEMRLFSATLLALWVVLVALFVIAATKGLPFRIKTGRRLGA
ncbi:MAG: hypothetical protein ACUX7D_05150 [Candidatus Methanodesulfokora washburnensis]|jgi:hypothetical protein